MSIHVGPLVLMADDDDDDCALATDAFEQSGSHGSIKCVEDGIRLMEYLSNSQTLPALILLDLNMPRKDGRQVLREIRLIPELKSVPVVVLTTSQEEKDIVFSRQMGAKSFITKPARFSEWVKMMKSLAAEWLDA